MGEQRGALRIGDTGRTHPLSGSRPGRQRPLPTRGRTERRVLRTIAVPARWAHHIHFGSTGAALSKVNLRLGRGEARQGQQLRQANPLGFVIRGDKRA